MTNKITAETRREDVYTRVTDLDSAIGRARALGSRVLVPPTRHGDTVIAVVSDPAGHPIGLCT